LLVSIQPKVPVGNLLYMLAAASGPAWFHTPNIRLDVEGDASTLLASALVTEVERLLRSGLGADFAPREADLPLVRGRIMLGRQVTRHGEMKHRHSCAYAERTPDTSENRILLAALRFVSAVLSEQEAALRRKMLTLIPTFEDVARLARGQAASTLRALRVQRHNARYAPALSLCALILNNLTITNRTGNVPFASFLVDMPRLFEVYLTNRLRALLPDRGLRVVAQRHDYLDEAGRVRIRPDILVYPQRGNGPLLVVDAKYRALSQGGDLSTDLYQLGAYVGRYTLSSGALVYPQPDAEAPTEVLLRGSGKRLYILSLDLSAPTPAALDARCQELAAEIERISLL
jgi:5-methylcytosine-specific restriction enzyme subunit McrC